MTMTESGTPSGTSVPETKNPPAKSAPVPRARPWQAYLNEAALGLNNYWYPAFFSQELEEGGTLAEEVCGERMIFKRVKGEVYAVRDRCAHRGVAFSVRPECLSDNTLTCWYHGFTYDVRNGELVQVGSHPGSNLIGKLKIPTFKVREAFSMVWVFIGDEDRPFEEDLPPVLQRALSGEERRAFFPVARVKIPSDWRLGMENGIDAGHVWGHRDAELVRQGPLPNPLGFFPRDTRGVTTDTTPGHAAKMDTGHTSYENVWTVEIEGNTISAARLPSDTQAAAQLGEALESFSDTPEKLFDDLGVYLPGMFVLASFPDGHQVGYEWYVPVDEHHHMYTILASEIVHSDEEEAKYLEEYKNRWADLVWSKDPDLIGFNNFDAFAREQIAHGYDHEDFWQNEHLYLPDFVITQWRQFVSREARGFVQRGDLAPRPDDPEPSVIKYVH
ncbi:Rieske 2Fe-2S domain-containing protein [Microbacterium sp. X-17]|uniref:Rieske 2Fe-2S domain-containing protein n=1 Tax=Microbacterium sp. X-17 TaxID=3144404 RepID=UPI0031F55C35